ncbi:hypothetical protein CFC21_043433 [Triticum aestivum]|uniref:Uncharacterized protein n=2 Tax=Triticum aestivum TaxID=4565 RepID=A0A9R1JWI1_WHEAT|nr:uncharacterized protein LOC119278045 [Triticum dicoccoides]XP_044351411.1 uncharacterized protein LOC123071900 [Triticum aestivum]KAF7032230.1 hypothetical protein CFC21_043433 [Triticum aestivum]CDM85603.1 unnamed protein product [Triticum aestivum]
MAHFQEVDYCSEEVRAVGNPARRGGGVQEHIVKETFVQEFDTSGRRHGHHGHHGRGSGHFEVRESRLEEDFNTRTGEFHERKENFVVRADD